MDVAPIGALTSWGLGPPKAPLKEGLSMKSEKVIPQGSSIENYISYIELLQLNSEKANNPV